MTTATETLSLTVSRVLDASPADTWSSCPTTRAQAAYRAELRARTAKKYARS